MVECFNCTLLRLLRAYVDKKDEWKNICLLHQTSVHTSTGVSAFELMFGRQPKTIYTRSQTGYAAVEEYQAVIQAKLAELTDFVKTHMVEQPDIKSRIMISAWK